MRLDIAVLPGDGVGPEVVAAGLTVLEATVQRFGHRLVVTRHPIGWAAATSCGDPLPAETRDACLDAQAVLLGAVGHPEGDNAHPTLRPEAGLLRLRRELGCYANLRPVTVSKHLADRSPLRGEIVRDTDLVFVRELAGGIYYGASEEDAGSGRAANTMEYTAAEVRRIAKVAFELAASRRGEVVSIDKANVLAVSRLWRSVVDEVAKSYPKVTCRHMLVDRAAMELVFRPSAFDVLLTPNLFGDILSDEAASLAGSIGLLSSASIGGHTDLYEPVHGSAPDIAGTDWVNPIGMIASIALMLRHSYGLRQEAETVEGAVEVVLAAGYRTADIRSDSGKCVGTQEFARLTADACATVATGDSDDIHTAVSAFSRPNEDD